MAISPQLLTQHSKDFLSQKKTILTEDDVLHYRKLSLGEIHKSDSSGDEEDLVLVNVFLRDDIFTNIGEKISKDDAAADTSSSQHLPAGVRGTESSYEDRQSWIYFPTGWSVTELEEASSSQGGGATVVTASINGQMVNLYHSTEGTVYCSQQRCPHAGGPLQEGEIEEIPETGQACIVCPWHKYCYNLLTGGIKRPSHRSEQLQVYPTRIEQDGQISIGFKSFHESFFSDENF